MAVIDNAFETKGTQVFFVDTATSSADTIRKLTCPTGVTGLKGGTKDRIDVTCLDQTGPFRAYIGGFADPAELSIPFILYKGDDSHAAILALQDSGDVVGWFLGLSDSDDEPTIIDSDGQIEPPAARSGFVFKGYVSNVTIDAAINDVIRGTLTVQPSGYTEYVEGA